MTRSALLLAIIVAVLVACTAPRSPEHVIPAASRTASGNLVPASEAPSSRAMETAASRSSVTLLPSPSATPAALRGSPAPTQLSDGGAVIGGTATWFCSRTSACTRGYGPSDYIGAIDRSLGILRGMRVRVYYGSRSVVVRIVDTCACAGARIIDLSRVAFARLADPGRGVIAVAIEVLR